MNLILGMGVSLGHKMLHILVKTFFKLWRRICFCSYYKEGGRAKRGCCPLINIGPSSPNCWLSYTNTNPPSTIGFIPFLLALVSVIEKQKNREMHLLWQKFGSCIYARRNGLVKLLKMEGNDWRAIFIWPRANSLSDLWQMETNSKVSGRKVSVSASHEQI